MDGRETPNQVTLRKAKEKRIVEAQNEGYALTVDMELDTYRYGEARKDLGVVAMYQYLKRKGSKAARFFEREAIEEASQKTDEIPVIA